MTAYQAFKKYKGDLAGKTIFVPAGRKSSPDSSLAHQDHTPFREANKPANTVSGTGAYACQLAKNVFKAGKVITTVSTSKISKVPQLLGANAVDEIIDYTKSDPNSIIPPRSVDFILDTTGQAMHFLSLMVPNTSLIISISTTPAAAQLEAADFMNRPDNPQLPAWGRIFLNATDSIRKWRAWRWSVEYSYMFLGANSEDLEAISRVVEEKKLVPVVGTRATLKDFESVRKAAQLVYDGKGGIGKAVITVA